MKQIDRNKSDCIVFSVIELSQNTGIITNTISSHMNVRHELSQISLSDEDDLR